MATYRAAYLGNAVNLAALLLFYLIWFFVLHPGDAGLRERGDLQAADPVAGTS
jgi:hypothetical protein